MLVRHENAIFLGAEEKSFKNNKGDTINFVKFRLLGDDNDLIEGSVDIGIHEQALAIEPRTEITCEIQVTEEAGKNGSYLKKRLMQVD